MSIASLERAILDEARTVTKRPKLRKKDLLAWSTSESGAKVGDPEKEVGAHLPGLHIYVVLPKVDAK